MTINQEAFKEAEKELQKDKINEIKGIMKSLLQKIQDQKEIKTKAEENLRLLKLDMEDLREGKIEKIKERHEKSKATRDISPITEMQLSDLVYHCTGSAYLGNVANNFVTSQGQINFPEITAGTYQINCSNGTIREFNF